MIGRHVQARFFCACCLDDINRETPRQAPLGRNRAMVNVCDDCAPLDAADIAAGADLPVVAATPARPAYNGGTGTGVAHFGEAISDALRKRQGDAAYEAESERLKREGIMPSQALSRGDQDAYGYDAESRRRKATTAWAGNRPHKVRKYR